MYRLYADRNCGSMAIEAVLALAGAPHQVEDVARGADRKFPEWLHRINPKGQVPTLVLPDDSVMTESAAMLIHLCDIFPEAGLAPAVTSPQRPRYLRWLVYLATAVYISDLRYYYPDRYSTDAAAAPGIKARAAEAIARDFAIYAEALGQRPFILGDTMSAVDIYAAMLATWVPDMGELFTRHPNLKAMYDAVVAEPRIAAVWARNGL